jgi:hypothetical protein
VSRREQRQTRPTLSMSEDGEVHHDLEETAVAEDGAAEELPNLRVDDVVPAHLVAERLAKQIVVAVDFSQVTDDSAMRVLIDRCTTLFKECPGACPVTFLVQSPGEVLLTLRVSDQWRVHPTTELVSGLRAIWGSDRITLVVTANTGKEQRAANTMASAHSD